MTTQRGGPTVPQHDSATAPEGTSPPEPAPASDPAPAPASGPTREPASARRRFRRTRATAVSVYRRPARPLTALIAGVLLALAFPPYDIWPLSVVGVTALSIAVHGRRTRTGFGYGLLFGLPFMLWLLKWLRVVGPDAWIVLSVVQALYIAALAAALTLIGRLRLWPLWTACLWVAEELIRDRIPFGGFPWGRLAFANTATPFTPLAALGGAPAVTFAVALSGALIAWAALRLYGAYGPGAASATGEARTARAGRRATLPTALGAIALAVAIPASAYAVPIPTKGDAAGPDTATIAVVQGNVPRTGLDFLGQRRAVLDNHVKATHKLAADVRAGRVEKPELVIWPENSSDLNPFEERDAYALIDGAVKDIGVPVLTGVLVAGPDATHIQNQGIVWDPVTGPGASYTKRHPVPFGEYIPMRDLLTKFISRLERVPRDFYPGKTVGVLQLGPARIGDVICFEIAYDNVTREAVTHGGRVLVVQTNNATYGRSGQPEQQLAMSRLRAVEHGRAVLIAATSGISAIVMPGGKVVERTREFTADTLVMNVPLRDDRTLATRLGSAPEWILAIVGLLACAYGILRRRREAATTTPGNQPTAKDAGTGSFADANAIKEMM
ncbi:apolipoprotein N-acyltransferase [Embleya sp. NBC_00896]|uniref:apolipoprotein N-acyltransferase n=1 Tax=Embleya sp. NBC_00896 TaxID=2975961 RepID=UPI00386CC01B|nr:apolipoprotein N-acyltransferase [Embleya sp. NBC_00896]